LQELSLWYRRILSLTFATSIVPRGQFWDFLGNAQVDSSQDHGRIQITRRGIQFRTIQLRVSGEAIFFDLLVVHFDDGTSQRLNISDRISPGGKSYVIDLLGERSLQSVELWITKNLGSQSDRECLRIHCQIPILRWSPQ